MQKGLLFGAALVIFTTSTVFADITVATIGNGGNYSGYGPYQTGVGGEFTLYSTGLASYIANYTPLAQNQWAVPSAEPNFQTFCVEGNEYIYANTTYDITFTGVTYDGDSLTAGAAYLYSQFASDGNFGGNATYNYGSGRSTTAAELQDAIWAFMGGQEGETMDLSNPFEKAAAIAIGGADTSAGWAVADTAVSAGYDGVSILGLWDVGEVDEAAGAAQDQLIWEGYPPPSPSVPDGGATVLLLGIGLGGLAFMRNRSRR